MNRLLKQIQKRPLTAMAVFVAVMVFLALVNSVVSAYFEARSFNHLTGRDVSTWDAIFIDLRVIDTPSKEGK